MNIFPKSDEGKHSVDRIYKEGVEVCKSDEDTVKLTKLKFREEIRALCIYGYYSDDLNCLISASEVCIALFNKRLSEDDPLEMNSILSSFDPFWIQSGIEYAMKMEKKNSKSSFKQLTRKIVNSIINISLNVYKPSEENMSLT